MGWEEVGMQGLPTPSQERQSSTGAEMCSMEKGMLNRSGQTCRMSAA